MMMNDMVTLVTSLLTSFSLNLFYPVPPLEFHKYFKVTFHQSLLYLSKHISSILTLSGSNVEGGPEFDLRVSLNLFQDLVNGSMFTLAACFPHFNVVRPKSLASQPILNKLSPSPFSF